MKLLDHFILNYTTETGVCICVCNGSNPHKLHFSISDVILHFQPFTNAPCIWTLSTLLHQHIDYYLWFTEACKTRMTMCATQWMWKNFLLANCRGPGTGTSLCLIGDHLNQLSMSTLKPMKHWLRSALFYYLCELSVRTIHSPIGFVWLRFTK